MRRTLPSTMSLVCFEAAARNENFTQAAMDVHLSQSAVSRQISILEELLKQKLFIRSKQRVKLTDAGHHYLAQVKPLLQTLEVESLRMPSYQELSGGLNIGTYPTLGSRWFIHHLIDFNKEHPEINCNTITYLDNAQLEPTHIDIGIVQGDPPWPGMSYDYLMPEQLAPVISPALLTREPIAVDTLKSHRLLQHNTRPLSWEIWYSSAKLEKPEQHSPLLFSQFEMIIEATIAGHGIAVLPMILIQKELRDQKLTLAHPHIAMPPSGYYLVSPQNKANNQKVKAFREWMLKATEPLRASS